MNGDILARGDGLGSLEKPEDDIFAANLDTEEEGWRIVDVLPFFGRWRAMASYATRLGSLSVANSPDFVVAAIAQTRKQAIDDALEACRALPDWPLVLDPLRIAGVAILLDGGIMIRLPPPARHHDLLRLAARRRIDGVHHGVQGFYTSRGRFVTRQEAVEIVSDAEQIVRKTGPADQLFSEDLW